MYHQCQVRLGPLDIAAAPSADDSISCCCQAVGDWQQEQRVKGVYCIDMQPKQTGSQLCVHSLQQDYQGDENKVRVRVQN
jgi:hypothetical protein